jgi:DNA-binding LacI/PurR family transcriptional regulator
VILPSVSNPVYHDILQGIQTIADQDQTLIFVCNTLEQPTLAWRYLNQLLSKGVDGIIVSSLNIESFNPQKSEKSLSESLPVPLVSIDTPESEGFSVNVDLADVGYQATKHLIQHGHQRIGLITYGFESLEYRMEDLGYKRALQEAGIPIEKELIIPVQGFESIDGRNGANRLLALTNPPTAVFTISDLLAVGVYQAINSSGLSIADDIALVGFNNNPIAEFLDPGLTTFDFPGSQLGIIAMEMLVTLIKGDQPHKPTSFLPTPMIIRQSCGC